MSTDRLADYTGRHWALKEDENGVIVGVHHFDSEEMRDAWIAMEPTTRVPATARHPNVRRWVTTRIPKRAPWWRRVLRFLRITY